MDWTHQPNGAYAVGGLKKQNLINWTMYPRILLHEKHKFKVKG